MYVLNLQQLVHHYLQLREATNANKDTIVLKGQDSHFSVHLVKLVQTPA